MAGTLGTQVAPADTMQQATLSFHSAPSEPRVACIRLTRGSSAHAVWYLEEGVGGTFLTIGANGECDWQIRAAAVPPEAVSLLALGGKLYARSGPSGGVRLNTQLLTEDWTEIERDARIDVGLASLDIKITTRAALPSLAELSKSGRHILSNSGRHIGEAPLDPDHSGVRPSLVPAPEPEAEERAPRRPSLFERFSRHSAIDAPSVLGRIPRATVIGWPYYVLTSLVLGGYAIWVALLD